MQTRTNVAKTIGGQTVKITKLSTRPYTHKRMDLKWILPKKKTQKHSSSATEQLIIKLRSTLCCDEKGFDATRNKNYMNCGSRKCHIL